MQTTNYKIIRNFVEFYGKPFTGDVVAGETGIPIQKTIRVLNTMSYKGLIKSISMQGKFAIYIKNSDYVDKNPMNSFNFEIKFLKAIIRKLKTEEVKSARHLADLLKCGRRRVTRYLVALCSIGMVGLVDKKYKVIKDMDLLLVGSRYDSQILKKLKAKNKQ